MTDYWLWFEWQHRGSPHVHGLVWLPNAPDVEQLLSSPGIVSGKKITKYADSIVSTCNPAVLPDGTNIGDAPAPKPIHTYVTQDMETFTTLIKILLTW